MLAARSAHGDWWYSLLDALRKGDLLTKLARRGPFMLPLVLCLIVILGLVFVFLLALLARAILMKRDGHRCPKCGAHDVRLSTTTTLYDFPFRCFSLAAMRCRPCRARYYVLTSRVTEPKAKA